jgi:tRNA (uracil-5-)-methyltransferase
MALDSNKKLKNFYAQRFGDIRANETLVESTSKYFGEVGSTPLEDIPYKRQVEVKKDALKTIFSNEDLELSQEMISQIDVIESPTTEEYRLKMEFVADFNPFQNPSSRFGQRKKGKFNWVIDMDESNLIDEKWFKKLRKLYEKLQLLGIRNYDLVKHDGNLRYLVLRCQGKNAMLSIITKEESDETTAIINDVAEFALELGFKSVYWNVNSTIGDKADGKLKRIWGMQEMEVEMYGYKFLINPQTFFQNNILGFEVLLEYVEEKIKTLTPTLSLIGEEVKSSRPLAMPGGRQGKGLRGGWSQTEELLTENSKTILYDLYSGVGTLGIIFSKYFEKVIGFEIVQESVRLAKENMKLNEITNYEISQADLNSPSDERRRGHVTAPSNELINEHKFLIVDPPRIGLEKNGVKHILNLEPKFIVYISCNPITQVQDLIMLKDKYEVVDIKGFDLFPHTLHMENVVVLKNR